MNKSIQERSAATESRDSRANGFVHVERTIEMSGLNGIIHLPECYQPSDGTWNEFSADIKRIFTKLRSDVKERTAETRESLASRMNKRETGGGDRAE
ncbi:MAG: hypothetical protein P4L46_12200 [Fimbriimonas sp.]|nr:hypothetical protein [Fimbriimonas sp.]